VKRLLPILSIVAVLLLLAAPAFAAENHTCDHSGTTIESLHHCVMHAYDMGHITNKGVANSLLAKLDAAQAALDRGQPGVAVNLLHAFINEVNAQAGKHIVTEHAIHLVGHARNVITALGG
jgi:competence protein ComGC